jgi:hypothetical protein
MKNQGTNRISFSIEIQLPNIPLSVDTNKGTPVFDFGDPLGLKPQVLFNQQRPFYLTNVYGYCLSTAADQYSVCGLEIIPIHEFDEVERPELAAFGTRNCVNVLQQSHFMGSRTGYFDIPNPVKIKTGLVINQLAITSMFAGAETIGDGKIYLTFYGSYDIYL